MRAAIYARMSTDKQSADSPADQIARCRAYAVVTLLGLCLACGCAGRIVPAGLGMFKVQGTSDAEAKKDAMAFCAKQGKMAMISPTRAFKEGEDPSFTLMSHDKGEIIFMCASPGDPGYEPPNQPTERK